jgi:hypothetical protein
MVAEITKEKKYQSRAFLILPMSFNVASFLGPGEFTTYPQPRISLLHFCPPKKKELPAPRFGDVGGSLAQK